MKKNKKGFVLTETLMVTVFVVVVFTFIYTAIIPLIGIYRDMSEREQDIDIVYKLYHIRKMILNDRNEYTITSNNVKRIVCNDFSDVTYCNSLMSKLELSNYELYYTSSIQNNMNSSLFSTEVKDYLANYSTTNKKTVILLDKINHTIAHLLLE